MDILSGNQLWPNITPIKNKYTYLNENIDCEVLIIGAGLIGSICAYYFTEAGINTTIVDKSIIGYGSTSSSIASLEYSAGCPLIELSNFIGSKHAIESYTLCEKAIKDIDEIMKNLKSNCNYISKEHLYYTDCDSKKENIKEEYTIRKKNGFNVEYVDNKTTKDLFSFNVVAGIYSLSGAAQVNPYLFAQELIASSKKKGLEIYENTKITNIIKEYGGLKLRTDKHNIIRCKKVIITTAYEYNQFLNGSFINFYNSYTLATTPIVKFNGWHNQCLIRDTNYLPHSLRTTLDDRIIINGEETPFSGCYGKLYNLFDKKKLSKNKYNSLNFHLRKMFPDIKDINIEFEFSSLIGKTKDTLPYIGEHIDYENYYFLLCTGENSILYGVIGSQLLRDLYLGEKSDSLNIFAFDR